MNPSPVSDAAVSSRTLSDSLLPEPGDTGPDLLEPPAAGLVDPPAAPAAVPGHVARHLLRGTSALGFGIVIERGMGFFANVLAARLGGLATFGAYSLAISTANNISTYAAGQIGSTAARFSGKYQHGSAGYTTLARALAIVSVVSAALGAVGLWFGAGPIAHLLGKTQPHRSSSLGRRLSRRHHPA